jgi:hypothetical protein
MLGCALGIVMTGCSLSVVMLGCALDDEVFRVVTLFCALINPLLANKTKPMRVME